MRAILILAGILVLTATCVRGGEPKPVPRMQVLPLPGAEVSFQDEGRELCRVHADKDQRRPFIYPVNGATGRSLTRMGHPHDPESHSHHNSVWISHVSVGGVNFWEDRGGKIEQVRVLRLEDGDDRAFVETENVWMDSGGKAVMHDRRRVSVKAKEAKEAKEGKDWLMLIDLQLEARTEDVVLGETAFGILGVRMAKTIGVSDGGGTIRNSEGGVDEAGCFRKRARWIDYSGPIAGNVLEGITLMDHRDNPGHPTAFHCRNDGWMGASLTFAGPMTIRKGEPLRLRYALFVHSGVANVDRIEREWREFAESAWEEFRK